MAYRFDSARRVTELYAINLNSITRHDIDSTLGTSRVELPKLGHPWVVEDLDLDGNVEMVTQGLSTLAVYSAPGWTSRGSWDFPGMDIEMDAVSANVDADSSMEVIATPTGFGGDARIVVLKFNGGTGNFDKVVDVAAPLGAAGHPAVADFDHDGRVELITGSMDNGYSLFEWQEGALVYIGPVGGPGVGNNFHAEAVRPKPDGLIYALLGFSSGDPTYVYRYELLAATGDNMFRLEHEFSRYGGGVGIHPSLGADVDCDGVDGLVMLFGTDAEEWEWDSGVGDWVQRCFWNGDSLGTVEWWYDVDLDQDGAAEFGNVNHLNIFRASPGLTCVSCDSSGHCTPPEFSCFCACHADPQCDGAVSDVMDVVKTVGVAFRGATSQRDPGPLCLRDQTDVDCSGCTDLLDVVKVVDVAFRGASASTRYCDPCAP